MGTVGEQGGLEGSLSPSQSHSPSPPPPSPASPPILGPRTKGMASTHLVERRHWVLSRYSGEPGRARGLDVPHPVGDQCPRKDPLSWHLLNEAARRHGRGSGRYREGPGKARDGTESLCSLLGWIVTEHECALRAMTTPDTPIPPCPHAGEVTRQAGRETEQGAQLPPGGQKWSHQGSRAPTHGGFGPAPPQ